MAPFFDLLLPSDFDSHGFNGSINARHEIQVDNQQPIMVLGGTSLTRIADARGWKPGSFLNDNFHYTKWREAYGNHLLNSDATVGTFRTIEPASDTFFMRPCEDSKDFAGTLFTKNEFTDWREELLPVDGTCAFADSDMIASSIKEINSEYRFFIVEGKISTCSQYKKEDQLYQSTDVPSSVIDFTNQMIDLWQPAKAFVIDIADTPLGLKVIEINNFNSAGFYAADVTKIIDAIENMET